MNKLIMVEPLPNGSEYGFPKKLPQTAIIHYGSNDYGISEDFDIVKWFEKQGYPLKQYQKYKWWVINDYDPDVHGGGVEDFGTYKPSTYTIHYH